jgi:hypothetical protein
MRLASVPNFFAEFFTKLVWLRQRGYKSSAGTVRNRAESAPIDRLENAHHLHPRLLSIAATAVMGAALSAATYSAVAIRENRAPPRVSQASRTYLTAASRQP